MTNLDSIFKSRDITLPTKVRLVKAMVFPVVMYGCESWAVKKAECRRMDAFELCCWRRVFVMTSAFSWQNSISLCPASFCSLRQHLPVTSGNLDSILKTTDITLPTKVRLVKVLVYPAVMYGCEGWTVKKAEHQRNDAFELWCWRRLLRVPWSARGSNQSNLKEISPQY